MARIVFDPAIRVVSGGVGNFVYRQQADGSVTMAKTALPNPDRQLSEAQLDQMQRFKEASARCQRLLEDPEVKAAYQQLLDGQGPRARLRAMVMGDIMKAPNIGTIDLSKYQFALGGTIRVVAEDNVGVTRLELAILDQTSGQSLLTEQKELNGSTARTVEWLHTTDVGIPDGHTAEVRVRAYDLAGNQAEMSQILD
jgi:hypothetical protein